MKLLLDTHILIWLAGETKHLSERALQLFEDESNDLIFSVVSIWEIMIKRTVARNVFDIEPVEFRLSLFKIGFEELAILSDHVIATGLLPLAHPDPFDRLLIAQATTEGLMLVTADATLTHYRGPIRRV